MPQDGKKLTPTTALAALAKRMPATVRKLETGQGLIGGMRGAGYWLAFTKSHAGVVVEAQVEKTEPAR